MSQCVSCANQPSDNDSLGGAAHEGTVTPMVIGIIIGTVVVFILVVCALFYCVKLENNKYIAKLGPDGGGTSDEDPASPPGPAMTATAASAGGGPHRRGDEYDGSGEQSVKSRPSSVTVVPSREAGVCGPPPAGVSIGGAAGSGNGGMKKLFGWKRKSGALPTDNCPVTAIEMV